ncbi:Uncharacterised protein [Bordetella pertussis]|nr:Uncharacterised protein [Bordetella pertussis]
MISDDCRIFSSKRTVGSISRNSPMTRGSSSRPNAWLAETRISFCPIWLSSRISARARSASSEARRA